MGRPAIRAFLAFLLTLVLSHSSKGGANAAKQIDLTKQSDKIQTSEMENPVFRATRDAKRKSFKRKKGSKQSKRSPDKERNKSGKAKKVTRKNNKNIERKRKKMMKLKGKERKNKKKELRKTKKGVTEKGKKSRTKKGRNKKKSGQKKKSKQNKKKGKKTRKKLGQEKIKKNELSKWNPKQACNEAALCQKIKDYIKISNQLRKVRRIVKSCDTMDKKDKKSATEFEATVTALETAIGSSSGRRRTYISRWRRAVESSDDVTSIKDKLKNCSVTAKAKCQKSSVAPCREEANLTKCESELQGWLTKFGPSKGSCLQASSDCCACITALPDVSKDCLAFDQKSTLAVASKKKCTSGEEQGSFGFCKKIQVEAAEKGPKHAKNNCPPSGPGSMTTNSPSFIISIEDYRKNCTNPGYSPCNLTKGGTHNGYCCPSLAVGFGYCLPEKKNCPMTPEDTCLTDIALAGGYNSGVKNMATSDIISSRGVCSQSLPLLPEALYGAQSVYFDNTLMVCGGDRANFNYIKKCHQLRDFNSPWTVGPSMNTPRRYFSMTRAGQDLYALGGEGGGGEVNPGHGPRLDSMEKLSSGVWTTMGEKLTAPRSAHCTLFMETTGSLVIIGGYPAINTVEQFKISTSTWTQLNPLPVELYGHGCIQLGQTILVTGGHTATQLQNKVYTYAEENWRQTGTLDLAREYHSMGTLDNKVLVLGGRIKNSFYYDTIQEMNAAGNFKVINWKLNEKKAYSAAAQVPRQMNPC